MNRAREYYIGLLTGIIGTVLGGWVGWFVIGPALLRWIVG